MSNSVFSRGARQGLIMGLYLSLLFIAMAASLSLPWLSIPALILIAGTPAVLFVMLRRSFIADHGLSLFSELWMQGIIIFFGGSLIMATVSYIYMKMIVPDYILSLFLQMVDVSRQMGNLAQADLLQRIIDQGQIFTPAEIAVEFIWLGVFSGSILSMVITWIVRRIKIPNSSQF